MPISGLPDRSTFSAKELQEFQFPKIPSTGQTEVEDDTLDGTLAIKLIIGLDFAVTRSSPDCCYLFAIDSEQTVELKLLILNKVNK